MWPWVLMIGGVLFVISAVLTIRDKDQAVLATIPEDQAHTWDIAALDDGIGIIVNGSAGYWVKDGVVYAVNGIAKNMSPSVAYAPAEITWLTLEQSIQE